MVFGEASPETHIKKGCVVTNNTALSVSFSLTAFVVHSQGFEPWTH